MTTSIVRLFWSSTKSYTYQVAAVQDWTTFGMVFMRPGYERGEELLSELARALEPVKVA